ncbi:MAG: Murein DD-endopeptidase MepM [Pelotomaculum sp. PtaB.Bin104]|nr:MAG: Murein DD-endopeptidase MepM [Pelotomaculum sp. PtaB.Bin104]
MPLIYGGVRRLPGLYKQWFTRQSMAKRIGMGLAIYFLIALSAYALWGDNACAVVVDGKVVAVVENEKNAKITLGELVKLKSDQTGMDVLIGEKVSYRGIRVEEEKILDQEGVEKFLAETLSFKTEGTAVVVNGEAKIFLSKNDEAQLLLSWLKSFFPSNPDEHVEFREEVELVSSQANIDELVNLEAAKELVLSGTSKNQQYTVREGDTVGDITVKFNINLSQLQSANPELDFDRLEVGQLISIIQKAPLINVIATREETLAEEIPYQIEIKNDDSLLVGEKKVIREGEPGQRVVTYRITRENGHEASRDVREQNIVCEPVNEIVAKGSQAVLASRGGSARLKWPCAGRVISPFGMRDGRMHQGIDLSAGYGSPITSSAGGTVIVAGWESGYGKTVEVSHGGGMVTRYAHLSTISVSAGQQVDRGQLIGLAGTTGRTTGPHLHFEVIINGQQRNPVNYL